MAGLASKMIGSLVPRGIKHSSLIACAPSCLRILQTMWVFERPVDIYIAFQATAHTCFCNAMT